MSLTSNILSKEEVEALLTGAVAPPRKPHTLPFFVYVYHKKEQKHLYLEIDETFVTHHLGNIDNVVMIEIEHLLCDLGMQIIEFSNDKKEVARKIKEKYLNILRNIAELSDIKEIMDKNPEFFV